MCVAAMDQLMKRMYKQSDKPRVGIFWYLPEEDDIIDDYNLLLDYGKDVPTEVYPVLHKTFWEENRRRAKRKDVKKGEVNTSVFEQEFNQIPRGRVSCHDGKFIVMVGSWYKRYEIQLTKWLEICFCLVDFEYKVVEYFELGHDGGGKELEY